MEDDAKGQVDGRDQQQSTEPLQQHGHQAHLEHVGVEHHQQDDDDVEQNADVLDAAGSVGEERTGKYFELKMTKRKLLMERLGQACE